MAWRHAVFDFFIKTSLIFSEFPKKSGILMIVKAILRDAILRHFEMSEKFVGMLQKFESKSCATPVSKVGRLGHRPPLPTPPSPPFSAHPLRRSEAVKTSSCALGGPSVTDPLSCATSWSFVARAVSDVGSRSFRLVSPSS